MLTLFHDFTSPASAVAVARLQRMADAGFPVRFAGFDAIGVDVTVPATAAVLAQWQDVVDLARAEGLVLRRPDRLPPTAAAHAVTDVAEDSGRGPAWRAACYHAFWTDGADLAAPDVLAAVAAAADVPADQVAEVLADESRVRAVRRAAVSYRRAGVGGVPVLQAHQTLVPGLLDPEDLRALAGAPRGAAVTGGDARTRARR